jgi:hypothetical protein
MSDRGVVILLTTDETRKRACRWIMQAPPKSIVTLDDPRRTIPQNKRMQAMLTDISRQVLYHGQRLGKEDFKLLFLDALGREMRLAPNLENNGFVNLGRQSSKLNVQEMTAMIELMFAWGAENGVTFNEPAELETI